MFYSPMKSKYRFDYCVTPAAAELLKAGEAAARLIGVLLSGPGHAWPPALRGGRPAVSKPAALPSSISVISARRPRRSHSA